MKINIFFIVAIIYFFFNSVLLPLGLLYTAILAPLFYVWLLLKNNSWVIIKFVLAISPFMIAHFISGVLIDDYIISLLSLFTVYIFIYTVYVFLKTRNYLAAILKRITILNFILTIIALITLVTNFEPKWLDLWNWSSVSTNVDKLPRLQLYTYEPSYYSTLLVPIIFYFFLSFTFQRQKQDLGYFLMLVVPLALSFSIGVIGAMCLSILVVLLFNLHNVRIKRNYFKSVIYFLVFICISAILIFILYPENPLYLRIYNILNGNDTSGRGRTSDSFEIAFLLLEKQNSWYWGVGLGQIKTIAFDLIVEYYHYIRSTVKAVAIPNAFAETLAIFGIVGATLRFLVQVFLFFKTKVYNNYFQSLCFTYIFIYQFTGSFITNIAEYLIWLLAFVPYFTLFQKQSGKIKS